MTAVAVPHRVPAGPLERKHPTGGGMRVTGVVKRWPKASARVLDDVRLEVAPGDAIWIGGRNGAGKTTLLRVMAGLIRPDAGSITLGSLDVERDREAFQRRTAFLPTGSSSLYARLTVAEHLRFWGRIAKLDAATRREASTRMLDALDLRDLAHRRVDRISMGQRQRVRLAGVFLHDPVLALLDEPANSLDEEGVALLASEVDRVRGRGGAVVWCSPSGDIGRYGFSRRLQLVDGRLEPPDSA